MDKNYEELANQFLDMSKPKDVEYIIINAGGTVFIYYKDEGALDLIQSGSPPDLIRYGVSPESCDAFRKVLDERDDWTYTPSNPKSIAAFGRKYLPSPVV